MPDHHTHLDLLGHREPVTVTWDLAWEGNAGDSYAEVEAVHSDLLGDLTALVLNSACANVGPKPSQMGFMLSTEPDAGWQDPIRTAMFGQVVVYRVGDPRVGARAQPGPGPLVGLRPPENYVHQCEPVRRTLSPHGTTYDRVRWEIEDSEAFQEALWARKNDDADWGY